MEGLLTPVGTTYLTPRNAESLLDEVVTTPRRPERAAGNFDGKTPESALEALKSEPDYDTLVAVLQYLARRSSGVPWSIARPSPQSAQIVHVLVSEIAPNYWTLLREGSNQGKHHGAKSKTSDLALFLSCLRSISGINAILVRLKALAQESKSSPSAIKRPDVSLNIAVALELLCAVLDSDLFLSETWKWTTTGVEDSIKKRPLANELVTIIGGGRIVSLAAEAQTAVKERPSESQKSWVADGKEYSTWLGRNIISWTRQAPPDEDIAICSNLLTKALRLGYPDVIFESLLNQLLRGEETQPDALDRLLGHIPQSEQRKTLFAILNLLSERYLNRLGRCDSSSDNAIIAAVAGAISKAVGKDDSRRNQLISWLTGTSGAGLGEGVGIRRAAMAVVSQDRDGIVTVLEKTLNLFGDQLYIKHSPLLQQEAHAQVLLLSAGYVHRIQPHKLTRLLRSSVWLNAISNRIAASQSKAKLMGIVVGEALSSLMDKSDKKLDFHMEETSSEESKWYKGLVLISDSVGPLSPLLNGASSSKAERRDPKPSKPKSTVPVSPLRKKLVIEEVEDDDSSDEDLVAYPKPDSDSEDSDDDPTMVRRDKAKAPVYIRDLIRYLRDTQNYDHQKLGLTTAPSLIRRKANFGTEVKDHAEELASILVGLHDQFEIEDFYDLRLQGMIAVIVAQPQTMGQWFAKSFFDGDHSISQRASMLVAMGLSARELAGFETSEYAAAASFPSKALPAGVEKLYLTPAQPDVGFSSSSLKALPPNALDMVAKSIVSDFLAPIAATAADSATGPDALKLSTYKSRLNQHSSKSGSSNRRGTGKSQPRVRTIPNTTAQLIASSFFFPLTARFQAAVRSTASRTHGIILQPYLLSQFLKTLALVLHAAGPSTLALPDMTAELWDLLLGSSVRAHSVGDLTVTHAMLVAALALLDVNEDRMRDVCRDQGRAVVEMQEWAARIFEGTRGEDGDGGEENEVKMLAAGVLIRLREGMEKYRLLLVGEMIGSE